MELTRNGLLFVTAIAAAGLLLTGMFMFPSGEKDGVSTDVNSPSVDIGQSVEPNNPVAVETETATEIVTATETGLKLLKEVGPTELPPYDTKVDGRALVVQTEEIKIEGFHVLVGANSRRDISISVVEINPEKRMVVLTLLRDEQGNVIESLCKEDEETGSPYFFRESFRKFGMHDRPSYAVPIAERKADKLRNVHSWEVLVYIG